MIDINKPSEGLDYTIEPLEDAGSEQAWVALVKTGNFKDVALMFTHVQYNGKEGTIKYQIDAVKVDGEDVEITESLQDYSFEVLQDIIRNGLANGSIVLDDKDTDNGSVARKQTV